MPLTSPTGVPPDPPRFLTDRGLGTKIVPEALRAAGFDVVTMQDHYGPAKAERLADEDWIPDVTQVGMTVFTKDSRTRFNRLIVHAIIASGARCFALARQDLTGRQMAQRLIDRVYARHPACGPGPTARRPRPTRRHTPTRSPPEPRSLGDQPDPAAPERPRLSTHQQPPLPLIEIREDRLELRYQRFPAHPEPHSAGSCPIRGTYGLFFDGPKANVLGTGRVFHSEPW